MTVKYKPEPRKNGPSCSDIATFLKLPHVKTTKDVDFVIAGVPFDTLTTFRPGTRLGPQAIRSAYTLSGYNTDLKVNIFDYLSGVDYGDIPIYSGNTDESFDSITKNITEILKAGVAPVIIGGDHSIAFPELMGYKEVLGPVAFVHFDSHLDTGYREMPEYAPHDHGTPFKDAIDNGCIITDHSIQIGIRGMRSQINRENTKKYSTDRGIEVITAAQGHEMGIDNISQKIREKVGDAPVFVTFDIDFLDPLYAPGTGTPEGCGFSTWETLEIIRKGLIGLNIKGFDLVEVNPLYDTGEITAMAGLRIAYEFVSLLACKKAGITEYKGFGGVK